jgi:hypothetical protein
MVAANEKYGSKRHFCLKCSKKEAVFDEKTLFF